MSESTSDAAYEAEPRRQRGLGRSPLGRVPQQGRSVLDALVAHDAWTRDHPGQLRGRRAGDAHLPERVEPVAAVVAVEVERAVEVEAPSFGDIEDHRTLGIETSATGPPFDPQHAPGVAFSAPEHQPARDGDGYAPDDDLEDTGPISLTGLGIQREEPAGGDVMALLRAMRDEG